MPTMLQWFLERSVYSRLRHCMSRRWVARKARLKYVKITHNRSMQVANEPSVGMYYVQEHVKKSVPHLLATKARAALPSAAPVRPKHMMLFVRTSRSGNHWDAQTMRAAHRIGQSLRAATPSGENNGNQAPGRALPVRQTAATSRPFGSPTTGFTGRRLDVKSGLDSMQLMGDCGVPLVQSCAPASPHLVTIPARASSCVCSALMAHLPTECKAALTQHLKRWIRSRRAMEGCR